MAATGQCDMQRGRHVFADVTGHEAAREARGTKDGDVEQFGHPHNEAAERVRKDAKSMYALVIKLLHDAAFVELVAQRLCALPVVPNERAGTWYTAPHLRTHGISAYFKSTDGHFGKWDFNLRRLNFSLLEFVGQRGGCILVDITRKGKRFPDSLAKTVPLWCAVINRAVQLDRADPSIAWDSSLHCPPSVSASEHSQMAALVDGFAARLRASSISVSDISQMIRKPLRPIWITPVTRMFNGCDANTRLWTAQDIVAFDFLPIVCVSASMDRLHMNPDDSPVIPLATDFMYIQGASDDSEMWAPGLSGALFWMLMERIDLHHMSAYECETQVLELIPSLIEEASSVLPTATSLTNDEGSSSNAAAASSMAFNWISDTGIAIGSFHAAMPPSCWDTFDTIINCGAREFPDTTQHLQALAKRGKRYLYLDIPEGKKGQNQLFACIPLAIEFVSGKAMQTGRRILVHCMQGKDRSVGICLAILTAFTDSHGMLSANGQVCYPGQLSIAFVIGVLVIQQGFA
eukprot:jgi/Hompol1/6660/HPOL_001284-RA